MRVYTCIHVFTRRPHSIKFPNSKDFIPWSKTTRIIFIDIHNRNKIIRRSNFHYRVTFYVFSVICICITFRFNEKYSWIGMKRDEQEGNVSYILNYRKMNFSLSAVILRLIWLGLYRCIIIHVRRDSLSSYSPDHEKPYRTYLLLIIFVETVPLCNLINT